MGEKLDEKKAFKILSQKNIFHFIMIILIFLSHILIYYKIYWDKDIIKKLFFYISFLKIISILIAFTSFILIKAKIFRFFKSNIKAIKNMGKIFLLITIIIGIFFSVIIIINTVYGKIFRNECPFNMSNKFNSTFRKEIIYENEEQSKEICKERRCIFYGYNKDSRYPYKYLCNYKAENDFSENFANPYSRTLTNGTEIKSYKQVECSIVGPSFNEFNDEIILDYFNLCYYLTDFYDCHRFNEPKKYDVEKNEECPDENYVFVMGILCTYIIIFDLLVSFIPWLIENKSYNLILEIKEEEDEKEKEKNKKKDRYGRKIKINKKGNNTNNKKRNTNNKKDNNNKNAYYSYENEGDYDNEDNKKATFIQKTRYSLKTSKIDFNKSETRFYYKSYNLSQIASNNGNDNITKRNDKNYSDNKIDIKLNKDNVSNKDENNKEFEKDKKNKYNRNYEEKSNVSNDKKKHLI